MKPLAIIPVYNEWDILPAVLRHLRAQECVPYVLDNWSTDSIPAEAVDEVWPSVAVRAVAEGRSFSDVLRAIRDSYDWTGILQRVEEIALANPGRWVMLHDADEIRRGLPGRTLHESLIIAEDRGYNAVEFGVREYVPVDNSWVPGRDAENHFRYYRLPRVDSCLPHVKAWYQQRQRVDLHSSGGHSVAFAGRNISPVPFLLKHYPIRSQAHGERKVLRERLPRYSQKERAMNWHVQYDQYIEQPAPNFLGDPKELIYDAEVP